MQTNSILRVLPKFTFKVRPQVHEVVPTDERVAAFLAVSSLCNSIYHDNRHLFSSFIPSDLRSTPNVYNISQHYIPSFFKSKHSSAGSPSSGSPSSGSPSSGSPSSGSPSSGSPSSGSPSSGSPSSGSPSSGSPSSGSAGSPSSWHSKIIELVKKLNANKVDYCFGGALALTQSGYVRATRDLDLNISQGQVDLLLKILKEVGYHVDAETRRILRTEGHVRVLAPTKAELHIDIFYPTEGNPLPAEALASPVSIAFEGESIRVVPLTILFIMKFLLHCIEEGRDKDFVDLVEVLKCNPGGIDREFLLDALHVHAGGLPADVIPKVQALLEKYKPN